MSWRESQKAKLRQALEDTALHLFRDQGYERTTIEQITNAVGVAKGTFFNHFASKEQVLAEWHRGATLEALTEVQGDRFVTCREAVMCLLRTLARQATGEPDLFQMTARHVVGSDVLSEEEQALDTALHGFFMGHIVRGIEGGELVADLDPELFAAMILTTLTGTGHEWVVARQAFDLEDMLRQRVAFLFRAATRT